MGERVAQVVRRERGEPDVLPQDVRDRRPVVGEGDLGLGRSDRRQVVAPHPAAEGQAAVVSILARLPRDGVRRVEDLDLVGHLVVPVRMVWVVHGDPEDLPGRGQRPALEGFAYPTGSVDRRVLGCVGKDGEDGLRRCMDGRSGADTFIGHVLSPDERVCYHI